MWVVAFGQNKGGVGKSTICINLAVELASAAIIDLDEQKSVMKWRARRHGLGRTEPPALFADIRTLPGMLNELRAAGVKTVLLDCPGRRTPLVNEAIKLADLVIVPSRPRDIDIEASGETIAIAQRLNKPYVFLLNSAGPGSRTANFSRNLEAHGHPVAPVVIGEHIAFADAVAEGLGVSELGAGKARSEMEALAQWLVQTLNNQPTGESQ